MSIMTGKYEFINLITTMNDNFKIKQPFGEF